MDHRLAASLAVAAALALSPATSSAASADNNLEWAGINHLPSQDHRPLCPVGGESFDVQIRTWRDDATSVVVHWSDGGGGSVGAAVTGQLGPYDIWEASIPATTATSRVTYYFSLFDGTDNDFYGRDGLATTAPVLADRFVVDFSTLEHAPYGATVHPGGGVTFRVWAQGSTSAYVRGAFNGWGLGDPMAQIGEDFVAHVPAATVNQRYKFYFDDLVWNTDARARSVDAGDNYNAIVDDSTLFPWASDGFQTPPLEEMVIYQIHVGTFAGRNDPFGAESYPSGYRDVADRVSHLVELGVNAVMLMPVTEFPTDVSAGYNPILQSAPERAYGIPNDFRRLVDAMHQNGIAVLLDVVWNHFSSTDNVLWNYNGNQIYFDTPAVETPWGSQADFDAQEVRDFYIDSMHTWFGDYRVDGFRMDGTDFINIDQHGASGWALMQRLNDEVDNRWADRVIIAEQLPDDSAVTTPTSLGGAGFDSQYFDGFTDNLRQEILDAAFGDPEMWRIRDIINGYGSSLSGVRVTNYVELHDEVWPNNGGQRIVKNIDTTAPHDDMWAKGRTKLAQGLVLTAPGVPAMFMGTEWLEDTDFDTTVNNRIDWSKKTTYAGIFDYYRDLIGLRTSEPGLRADAFNDVFHVDEGNNVIAFRRGLGDDTVVAIANFSNSTRSGYRVGVSSAGSWDILMESEDAQYDGAGATNTSPLVSEDVAWSGMGQSVVLDLSPMDLVLLKRDPSPVAADPAVPNTRVSLALAGPNPASRGTALSYSLGADQDVRITLHDLRGRRIRVLLDARRTAGAHLLRVDTRDLAQGVYFVRLRTEDAALAQKISVLR